MRLAVDVMGGDHAPDAILAGCFRALDPASGAIPEGGRLVLVGDEAAILDVAKEHGVDPTTFDLVPTTEVIAMGESPAKAVRSKSDSSIVRSAKMGSAKVKGSAEHVDAILSAGNTGACVSAAIMHLKRLPRVHRPGIAVTIPGFQGPIVLCDAGANPEPQPTHLWQYGVMAEAYARTVLHIDRPRVALMNIGAEEGKGTDLIQRTRDLLAATPGINFTGYIEGRDFFDGAADVVVTDGFVGNTVLKMAEGLARSLFGAIAQAVFAEDAELALRIEPAIKTLYAKSDYEELGGAPLLGVNGTYIIAHGSSKAKTICASIRNGFEYLRLGLNDVLLQRIEEVEAAIDQEVLRESVRA
ncbi:MAG: phosphate acyltransferase PlsX [Phycisphaerales bacterium JB060]